jgi:hypothetical protein
MPGMESFFAGAFTAAFGGDVVLGAANGPIDFAGAAKGLRAVAPAVRGVAGP